MAFPFLSDVVRALTGLSVPLPIPMFGVMVVAAFVIATWVFRLELARLYADERIGPVTRTNLDQGGEITAMASPQSIAGDIAMVVGVCGIIGARIFSFLEY